MHNVLQEVISHPRYYRHDKLRHGICIPQTCPDIARNLTLYKNDEALLRSAISECFTNKYEQDGLKAFVTAIHCETDQPFRVPDVFDYTYG